MTDEPKPTDPQEEYFDNKRTGVEVETTEHEAEVQPWNPELIRVHTKHFSLRQVVDMIDDQDIDIAPNFQRLYVWKDWQKWSLIESILLGIPLPTFYFNEDSEGKMQVVDGVQRLTTIFNFVRRAQFPLGDVDYLHELRGCTFDNLSPSFRRRMNNTQFVVHVIDPQTPYRVKFDIFRRINTGGSPLSSQEIRHCMSRARSRKLLQELSSSKSFSQATGGSLNNHIRMADREVVLRFCAFRALSVDKYDKADTLDSFLGRVTELLDEASSFSDADMQDLIAAFHRGMNNSFTVFGDHTFRKWPLGVERRNPINRALFEVWGVTLSRYEEQLVTAKAEELRSAARALMTDNDAFIEAISQGTGDPRRVRHRFSLAKDVVEGVLG